MADTFKLKEVSMGLLKRLYKKMFERLYKKTFKKALEELTAGCVVICLLTGMLAGSSYAAILEADTGSEEKMPLISGSFIQGWLCRDWTQDRWNSELAAMKELGMKSLIIQSSYDLATTAANSSAYGQDWSKYTTTSRYSLYPTSISELAGAYNSADQLERAFIAAKANKMNIFIGLISDDRWWRFGWGVPNSEGYGANLVTDSYFAKWCDYNGQLSAKMIDEIWDRYGKKYADQIGGFYYHNEIWNFDVACAGTDNGVYAKILANNFNYYLEAINNNCKDKPLMLSPYFNRTLSTGAQYGEFWKDVFEYADFREGDIFAPQDCIGEHEDKISTADEWIGNLASAAANENGMRFWVNNETFTPYYSSAAVSRVISQIEATTEYVETHILFSWNHYYNPLVNSSYQSYNDVLKSYIATEEAKRNKIDGGIEINGFQISTTAEGFRTVYSVENEIDGKVVVGRGMIYALSEYVNDEDLYIGNEGEYVKSFAGTTEIGKCTENYSDSTTATSFAMTMKFAAKTAKEYGTEYIIRAYAKLSDGTYVYSDVVKYTNFQVATQLYNNNMMSSVVGHNYLYTNILSVVDESFVRVEFDYSNTFI